jgi:fructose-bisphosphate aldolase class II/tagatose 1,6-diphosphate aldolase GatY/KbaY
MELLSEIHQVTDATLVLQGGSGVPHIDLSETIERGICKINLATEIKNIFIHTLKNEWLCSN